MEKDYEFLIEKQNVFATVIRDSLTTMGTKLDGEMEQLKEKHHFTESRLYDVESEVHRTSENG